MGTIVAISGGELTDFRSKLINDTIIRLSQKRNPKVLFIPTASDDSESYFEKFKEHFSDEFQCDFTPLYLIKDNPSIATIEQMVFASDLIYVGGGNTLKMMQIWRKTGAADILRKAYTKGIVLSGLSAGAICWFKYGSSDSRMFMNPNAGLIRVRGLNLVNALFCPHYDTEANRKPHLKELMKKTPGIALALDDYCALVIIDNNFKLFSFKENANGYQLYWKNGLYHEAILEKNGPFVPLESIIKIM